jgi:hypothetical protein
MDLPDNAGALLTYFGFNGYFVTHSNRVGQAKVILAEFSDDPTGYFTVVRKANRIPASS